MKYLFGIIAGLVASASFAASICDVTYYTETETADGNDVGVVSATVKAVPIADILSDAAKFKKVIDVASKEQDKGGPYTVTMTETRVCDGGTAQRAQGIEVRGVTLAGTNRIVDSTLAQGALVNNRFKERAAKGQKTGWDHSKAPKVKRNDVGDRVK